MNATIDVSALQDLRIETKNDSSMQDVEKAQILGLINHIDTQMRYVSNSSRLDISVAAFLEDNHYLSPTSYSDYSQSLLQKKLLASLGQNMREKERIEWEISQGNNDIRTAPIDQNDDQIDLEKIKSGQEKSSHLDEQVLLDDKATGIKDLKSVRDHAQILLLRDAKRVTELPADMEQYKNFYENRLLHAMMKPGDPEEIY